MKPRDEPSGISVAPRLVVVEWLDSGMAIGGEWKTSGEFIEHVHESDNILLVTTLGYLLQEDDEHLIVAQSRDEHNDQYLNAQVIYRPCVREVRDVTWEEPAT
jgi:hypothetical protein